MRPGTSTLGETPGAAVELSSLVGLRTLDAVDFLTTQVEHWPGAEPDDAQVCRFRLEGTTYIATEDPNDGYRSALGTLATTAETPVNVFPPNLVLGVWKTEGRGVYSACDVLEFYDVNTGKLVLEIGTDRSDDYYPSFVASFHPENMLLNAEQGT